jgi:para-nitrobenzyl esterase
VHSVPGSLCTRVLAEEVAAALADRVGAAPDVDALSDVDPSRLAGELTALGVDLPGHRKRWGRLSQTGVAVCPVVDGEVLTETPWTALAGGRTGGIELLAGHTRDEFRLFTVMMGRLGTFTEDESRTALDLFAPAPDGADALPCRLPAGHP